MTLWAHGISKSCVVSMGNDAYLKPHSCRAYFMCDHFYSLELWVMKFWIGYNLNNIVRCGFDQTQKLVVKTECV